MAADGSRYDGGTVSGAGVGDAPMDCELVPPFAPDACARIGGMNRNPPRSAESKAAECATWFCMAATWCLLTGDEARARVLLAQMKERDRSETDAYWRAYRIPWLLPIWSRLEPAEAAAKFLHELDEPMSYLSLDEISSNHWVYRPLLLDARVRAQLVNQGKWLSYLAERVPEYAEFNATK